MKTRLLKRLLGYVVFPDNIRSLFAGFMLFQNPDDLFFRKSCSHVNHSIFLILTHCD